MLSVASATRLTPMSALPPGPVDQAGGADDFSRMLGQRGDRLARGEPSRDDVLDHQHARAGRNRESPAQLEDAVLALDEDRFGAEPARGLVAGNDAAERGRCDDVNRSKRLAGFLGQRAAQASCASRILEHEHLLQKHRRVQPRRQDEMAGEQGAGGAKLVKRLIRS